ncbi:MAG: FIST C-terminal domain-containing protein [Trueperaceae bacterium]|nr:FIST C-terminal domain-containing protein [Trueperaceae bacterium]
MCTAKSIQTFSYHEVSGWSLPEFPPLDSEKTLVLVFADSDFIARPQLLSDLKQAYPTAKMMGCSTSGEIAGSSLSENSAVVAVVQFEKTSLRLASVAVASSGTSYDAAVSLAQDLAAPDLRGVFVLSDGLRVNGSDLVRGLRETLAEHVTITGGLAGDKTKFERTWVIDQGRAASGKVTALGFYGEHIRMGYGSQGGWDIFGIERKVTRAKGNVLFEIDHKPALELYKKYLGELVSGLPGTALLFPLGLRMEDHGQQYLVRTILGVDEDHQSLTFAGDIPEGSWVRLMKAHPERLIDGAARSAQLAVSGGFSENALSIAVSCVGRRLVLKQRTEEELEASLEHMPQVRQIGFYSYGEISPLNGGRCDLHNQTMTLTLLYET